MDEVDKIIWQSLRHIGCKFDSDLAIWSHFSPELIINAVSLCLQEINPVANTLPRTLPQNMAQRFVTATAVAEACAANGYRNDIGYQTFLYPNKDEVRRLFMFLVERMSKYNRMQTNMVVNNVTMNTGLQQMQQDIKRLTLQEFKQCWLPSYCRGIQHETWQPQLNLIALPKQLPHFVANKNELISTVLHKNAYDLNYKDLTVGKLAFTTTTTSGMKNTDIKSIITDVAGNNEKYPIKKFETAIHKLKQEIECCNMAGEKFSNKLLEIKSEEQSVAMQLEELEKIYKLKERSNIVLQDAMENVPKLEALLSNIKARREQLQQQWQQYRALMELQLKTVKEQKHLLSAEELQRTISMLEVQLFEKRTQHAQIVRDLKVLLINTENAITRQEYTRRLHEFSGNIRKQQNDINKVLQDNRDIQKQINTVDAQLRRQFNYTDDLLFQSAKKDAHAKRAYKILISLHASCSKLVELTTLTSNISKQVRELEVQIDREKDKNIASTLQNISADVLNLQNAMKSIQAEINKEENKITAD